MPISLETLTAVAANGQTAAKTYTTKFFHNKLTGNGKKMGLLTEYRNPVYIKKDVTTNNENINLIAKKYVNGNTTTYVIPFSILSERNYETAGYISAPNYNTLVDIGTLSIASTGATYKVGMEMKPHTLILEETTEKSGVTKREVTTCYEIHLYCYDSAKKTTSDYNVVLSRNSNARIGRNDCYIMYSCNPLVDYENIIKPTIISSGMTPDDKAFVDYISDYELFGNIINQSEIWQTTIHEIIDKYLARIVKNNARELNKTEPDLPGIVKKDVISLLRYIETYNIPLDLYRDIYNSIKKHFPTPIATELCKQNLNLLLSDTLNDLDQNKPNLTAIPTPQPKVSVPKFYSKEQKAAITEKDPLVLVQSGAGSGKSTVIRGRIEYMINSGVNPSDITVLSFTNAAADHITEICPGVNSMTIARMIHEIYTENFSGHELSSIDTIRNTLDIYYPDDQFAQTFNSKLYSVAKNDNNAFTAMNNFIEANYDKVIDILNTIKQTSLELEIIICYQQIENFKEPDSVTSKYLIIDEVQDNSIFEFIYILKYTSKHKESLFIVGRL